MYAGETMLFLKIVLILGIGIILLSLFNYLMRKHLRVEKTSMFSYNHVNKKHKKIDWTIRIVSMIIIPLLYSYMLQNPEKNLWYLQSWILIIVFFIGIETVRTIMEWKYAENRNRYLLTVINLIFYIVLISIVIGTNFFNLI